MVGEQESSNQTNVDITNRYFKSLTSPQELKTLD